MELIKLEDRNIVQVLKKTIEWLIVGKHGKIVQVFVEERDGMWNVRIVYREG